MAILMVWLGLSLTSAWLYRKGGTSAGTKWRDLGVPCVAIAYLLVLGIKVPWWAYLLQFGLLFGALTAYWGLDEKKWGFWAHGLGLSLATLPIAFITGHWLGFVIRSVVLTGFITIWSEFCKDVNWEEGGRGFFITATLPLLLI